MKLLNNDFIRPFALGFIASSALVLVTMHHAPAEAVSQSLLPSAHAASVQAK
jgi:hypothetical protein